MNCPKCKTTSLGPLQVNMLLELDHCATCGGVWFDHQEVYSKIKGQMKFYELFKEAYKKSTPTDIACPRDGDKMIQAVIEKIDLPFEACEKCGGLWFDQGEVESLNKFLESWNTGS